ncbi:hypothetical protein [Bradyrhizobium sp. 188]|uniref:hypothetical protein n=1 Tax=Bradyrhizobium sp. 188 TaxID=2782656 RepID=UPI001FFB476D|nr:hypothetical protein [Bradyrhizobium sp. 188]MCK1498661.1 hypothetical protein [Bradyrhizobium sp. 188]
MAEVNSLIRANPISEVKGLIALADFAQRCPYLGDTALQQLPNRSASSVGTDEQIAAHAPSGRKVQPRRGARRTECGARRT